MLVLLFVLGVASMSAAQRGSFAGSRPIGFPEIHAPTESSNQLENKFGEGDASTASTASTTTQRLPVQANGDRDLVDRLSKLPVDQQPFWFINWQAYESNQNKPQTWPQKQNNFIVQVPNSGVGSSSQNSNFGTINKIPTAGPATYKPVQDEIANRFGEDDGTPMTSEAKWQQEYMAEVNKKIVNEYTKFN